MQEAGYIGVVAHATGWADTLATSATTRAGQRRGIVYGCSYCEQKEQTLATCNDCSLIACPDFAWMSHGKWSCGSCAILKLERVGNKSSMEPEDDDILQLLCHLLQTCGSNRALDYEVNLVNLVDDSYPVVRSVGDNACSENCA